MRNNLISMTGFIYKITNKINGMSYFGQTRQSLKKRFGDHCRMSSNCLYLRNAISLYGKNSFIIELIDTIISPDNEDLCKKLNILEKKYIEDSNTLHPNGYNLTSGGNQTIFNKESIQKRVDKLKKPIICNETGKIYTSSVDAAKEFNVNPGRINRVLRGKRKHFRKMSFSYYKINGNHKGKPLPKNIENDRHLDFRGKTRSKEQIEKLRERFSKPIICNETRTTYTSITRAASILGIPREGICKVLSGHIKTYRGLTFSYLPKQS